MDKYPQDKRMQNMYSHHHGCWQPVASFTKEVNPQLAKRPLVFNGRLANRVLTSLLKETTVATYGSKIPAGMTLTWFTRNL